MNAPSMRQEWRACLAFIQHPHLSRDLPRSPPGPGWFADWWPVISVSRLLAWAATLWFLNIIALGPVVLAVFEMSGASHRISVHNLPWLQAILWAPLVEELLFRFGLRRPFQALWIVPVLVVVLLNGLAWWASSLLAVTVGLCWWSTWASSGPRAWAFKWLRRYQVLFPLVFHTVAIIFASVHIRNFLFTDIAWWMMVILVLPQWVTGLVLGWMRVTRGVGAAMLLHGAFNAGPLVLAWLALQFLGDI